MHLIKLKFITVNDHRNMPKGQELKKALKYLDLAPRGHDVMKVK